MVTATVVLLHGVGLDHTMWAPVRSRLPHELRVVAPDLLGHGANAAAPEGTTLEDLARDVVEHLDGPAHLVGFSLGALVAQHIAVTQPQTVASLTSVSSVCARTDAERASVLGRLATADSDFEASVEASIDRWFTGTDVDPEVVAATRATLLANDRPSYLACYRVFATADEELAPRLVSITSPALAITGADDPGSTPDMTERLAARIPGCRAEVVAGARHMFPVVQPDALIHALVPFIEGASR